MAAKIVVPASPSEATLESLEKDLRVIFERHGKAITRIRVDKRRQGLRDGAVVEEIECKQEAGESEEDHARSCIEKVVEVIKRDASKPRTQRAGGHVGTWLGTVVLISHLEAPKKQELARVDVRIEDPDELMSLDYESVAMINVVRVFLAGMCREMVGVMGAAKEREQAMADLVVGVAKSVSRESAERYKWDYKRERVRERVEEKRITEEGKTQRSEARWEAIDSILVEYKDVIDYWARYAADLEQGPAMPGVGSKGRKRDRKERHAPTPPTRAEVERIFEGEQFDKQRAILAEMLLTVDVHRRLDLGKQFRDSLDELSAEQKLELQRRALIVYVTAEKAKSVFAWIAAPVTAPPSDESEKP